MALMYSRDIKAKYAVKVRVAHTSVESIPVVLPSATPGRVLTLAGKPCPRVLLLPLCMESFAAQSVPNPTLVNFYCEQVFTDMSEGARGDQEVVITGDALVKRCPRQDRRRGDVVEPDYGGRMQVRTAVHRPATNQMPSALPSCGLLWQATQPSLLRPL